MKPTAAGLFLKKGIIENIQMSFSDNKSLKINICKGRDVMERPVQRFYKVKRGGFTSLLVHSKDIHRVLGPVNLNEVPELNSEIPVWLATHAIIQPDSSLDSGEQCSLKAP